MVDEQVALGAIDIHFGWFVSRFSEGSGTVFLGAALLSMATRSGHICLDLGEWAGRELAVAGRTMSAPDLVQWCQSLADSPAVGDGDEFTPLVLKGERLYLARYWGYEKEVAEWIAARVTGSLLSVDESVLTAGLRRWFPQASPDGDANQRLAALVCMFRPLVIITGGPGTGKTTTVALILALLAEQYLARGEHLRVALAAPTGKAAMRLQEAIARIKAAKNIPGEVAKVIPEHVVTVHRLLGPLGVTPNFRHDENNPLSYDLVVVDEASMVDLPLMAKLLRALPSGGRLILLGDRHQLSSVEPGAVLGDLCRTEGLPRFSRAMSDSLRKFEVVIDPAFVNNTSIGLGDSLVELQNSHRFSAASGIGCLGGAVRRGDGDGVWEILNDAARQDVLWREVSGPGQLEELLSGLVGEGVFAGLAGETPTAAWACGEEVQVLCALRRGPFGADSVNGYLERVLATGRKERMAVGGNYQGRPVMVLRNDYDLQLYNGDVGIVLADPESAGELRVFFPWTAGTFRKIVPARLPSHETVYAMTVHKSQGSEFGRVVLILPDRPSPVLTRELLYTALTRAKTRVEIWGGRQALASAIGTVTARHSGLREKLWGTLSDGFQR